MALRRPAAMMTMNRHRRLLQVVFTGDGGDLEKQERPKRLSSMILENDPSVTDEEWQKFDSDLFFFNENPSFAWYGGCFGQTKRVLTRAIPTACVGYRNGEIVFAANPDFLAQLEKKQRFMVYCHEIEHIVRSHISVIEDHPEKADVFNIVMDSLINEALLDYNNIWQDKDIPRWKVTDQYGQDTGKEATLITFDGLKQDIEMAKSFGAAAQKDLPASLTRHKFYHDYTAEGMLPYIPRNPEGEGSGYEEFEEIMRQLYGENGEFFDDGSVPDELKETLVSDMITEAEKSRGLTPGHLTSYIEKIKDKTNRDWRMMIRGLGRSQKIKSSFSWVKYNRKKPGICPGRYFKAGPRVLVMADTSGSISDGELIGFIKEINGLVERCQIDMAWVDAGFDPKNKEQFVRDIKTLKKFQMSAENPYGRGGTVFADFYAYALDNYGYYQHLLMLTDGYADSPPKRLVPGQQLMLMTPDHSGAFVEDAQAAGFKVAVIEDPKRRNIDG